MQLLKMKIQDETMEEKVEANSTLNLSYMVPVVER